MISRFNRHPAAAGYRLSDRWPLLLHGAFAGDLRLHDLRIL